MNDQSIKRIIETIAKKQAPKIEYMLEFDTVAVRVLMSRN